MKASMKPAAWLTDLLEEAMYRHYVENHPRLVEGIKILLASGEKPSQIKKFCEGVVGKSMTSNCVGYLIDYVNKQIKN